jgi:transcriptional regulator with XRE-family HTH domain
MILGHRLKEKREARGLTLEALGRLIAKDAQYIWKLESGRRSGVTSTTLKDLALALQTSADYLLGLSQAEALDTRATRPAARTRATRRPVARTNGHTQAPAPTAADPQPARRCPHCGTNMQPLDEGARRTCPGCHYTVADDT